MPGKNPILSMLKQMLFLGFENFGKYYSTYRAFVFDNEDPAGLQRIRLIIPQVTGNQFHDYWAWPKGVFYGQGYGSQVLPQRGDVVWVEFEGGCPELPIWSHGHPGEKEMPKDDQLKDPNCYWFITPRGHKIIVNDTKNTIHIEHRLGQAVELNENAVSIVSTKSVSFGKLNKSTYKAVQGENLQDVLNDIETVLSKLHGAFVKDLGIFIARGFINTAATIPEVVDEVATLKDKIKKILSNLVTLE